MPAILHHNGHQSAVSSHRPWRLIPPMTTSGQMQMAIDSWLLRQCEQGQPPTLRFYRWERPTVSLGYLQKSSPEHWIMLQQNYGFDIVRRPTGGRAVLHCGDLTYAVVARYQQGRRREIYQHLCEFLIRGWRSLGIELHYGEAGHNYRHEPNCFGVATPADLVDSQGHKFIGSAQRYGRNTHRDRPVLQHGSMQLSPNAELFTALFAEAAPKAQFLHIDDSLIAKIIKTLTAAAQTWFNVDVMVQPLSPQELAAIRSCCLTDAGCSDADAVRSEGDAEVG
ncbi:MAG: lipoate--protein ligase family protein [Elainellaceae cyanobacterium]